MKKIYISPEIGIVDGRVDNVLTSVSVGGNADKNYNGGNGGNNDAKGCPTDWDDEDWDDEECEYDY